VKRGIAFQGNVPCWPGMRCLRERGGKDGGMERWAGGGGDGVMGPADEAVGTDGVPRRR